MSHEKPKVYTAEFKGSAVKLANESAKPIAQTAGRAVNKIAVFGGRQVFNQTLAEALDMHGKLAPSPVEYGTIDFPGQRAR